MVTPMQEVMQGEDGTRYVREGNRWRVERSQPSTPQTGGEWGVQRMPNPAEDRAQQDQVWQADDRVYRRERDSVADARAVEANQRAVTAQALARSAAERAAQPNVEQAKASLYAGMMSGAERDYQSARRNGYDPGSARNQVARMVGVIPFDGDYFGRLVRDDTSDSANQAERRWAEANLRQLTGAAASGPEISRIAAINFDQSNDSLVDQRYRTRADTYAATRLAAGPAAERLPEAYPQPFDAAKADEAQPVFDFVGADPETAAAAIRRGGMFRNGPNGRPYRLEPQEPVRAQPAPGDEAASNGLYVRPQAAPAPVASQRGRFNPETGEIEWQ